MLGSHNSLTFREPKKWWMKVINFIAKCQEHTIEEQYEKDGVRCFDVRVRFSKEGDLIVAHGLVEYKVSKEELGGILKFLDEKGDCCVRLLHEARTKKQYTPESMNLFRDLCKTCEESYPGIRFWCGRNLFNWGVDYDFSYKPDCIELYGSVANPKVYVPKLYAKKENTNNYVKFISENGGTILDGEKILLLDFVNIF